jgi:prophage maintenance system killer protein
MNLLPTIRPEWESTLKAHGFSRGLAYILDGTKRTALMSTRRFYALNGRRIDCDRETQEPVSR